MAAKDTWWGFLLGAIIGSGGVLGYFIIDKKTQFTVDREFVLLISKMYQEHSTLKDMSTINMLSDVIMPVYESEAKYKKIIAKLIDNFSKNVGENDEIRLNDSAKIAPNETVQALINEKLLQPGDSVAEIRENFSGDLRKPFSDKLLRSINSGSQADVDRLIDAILVKSNPDAYRVNLYIAFTLARASTWRGSNQQKQQFDTLKITDLAKNGAGFDDSQFKLRVEQAERKFQLLR